MVKIPTKFEDLLPPVALGKILEVLNQPALSGAVREALHRVGIKDASPVEQVQEAWQQARDWVGQLANRMVSPVHANPQLINATGELARSEWHGFPMAPSVAEAFGTHAVNFHHACRLEEAANRAALQMTQAEDVFFASSLAAAIQLTQSAFESCAVSRADTVRVPGFGDLGAMLKDSCKQLHEVGATNGATEQDWSRTITHSNQALFLVSPNSLPQGDSDAQRLSALKIAKSTGAAVLELLIDGHIAPNSTESSFRFPVVHEQMQSGTTAVIMPLDGLLGGPAGACILGSAKLIKTLRNHPAANWLGLRGASLAAATAALERAAANSNALDTGVLDLLRSNIANLRDRAKRLTLQFANSEHVSQAELLERSVALGPSPWNRYVGPSVAVALTPRKDLNSLIATLHNGERGPSILCVEHGEKVLLDLRFVLPRDDHQIVKTLSGTSAFGESSQPA